MSDKLIKGMKNTHAAVESAKSICLDMHLVDFDQAVNYMSGQVVRIFPKSYESSTKRKRQISGVDTEGRGRGRGSGCGGRGRGRGRYGGRGGGRGGRGGRGGSGGGTTMMNGVNVADVTRSFSEDDWHKLGDAGRQYVNAERARNRGSGNDDNCNVSDVNTGGAGNDADNAGDDTATGTTNGNRGSQNGTRFGANGGRGRGGRNASAVTSCVRRINRVSMTEVKNKTVDGFVGRNEMDSHADTSCAGANWKAIELTGLTCDVCTGCHLCNGSDRRFGGDDYLGVSPYVVFLAQVSRIRF